jgi:outer membrane lipoprotein SlyB
MRVQPMWSMGLTFLLCGCAGHGGTMYSRSDAGRPWIVQEATVVQVNEASIEGRESIIGQVGGGFIGYSLGHAVGGGSGSDIAGAVAGVAGAVAGEKIEKVATRKNAWEILVNVEGGVEQLVIVQPADQSFIAGEKVRLYTRSDGSARVAKL